MNYSVDNLPAILRDATCTSTASCSRVQISQDSLQAGHETTAGGSRGAFFDHIHLGEALALYSLVRELRPQHSFEIGFCSGVSGLAILQALRDNGQGHHFACDPFQSSYAQNAGLKNVARAGLADRFTLFEKFPEEIASTLPPLEFAFIDSSHLFDLTMLDFVLIDKRLAVGGVVGLHDMWMRSQQKVVRFALSNRSYEIVRTPYLTPRPPPWSLLPRKLVARLLRLLPGAERLFTQDVLSPWEAFGFTNLAFLRKTATDQRDWRVHRPF
jgi:hypothetical protein